MRAMAGVPCWDPQVLIETEEPCIGKEMETIAHSSKFPLSFQGLSATWLWHRDQAASGPAAGERQHRYAVCVHGVLLASHPNPGRSYFIRGAARHLMH